MISSQNHRSVDFPASLKQLVVAALVVELRILNGVWLVVADVSKEVLIEVETAFVCSKLLLALPAHAKDRPELS